MTFTECFSEKNGFTTPKTFEEHSKNYNGKYETGYGIYVIFKNRNFSHSINKSIISDNEIKIDYENINKKLLKSDIVLIAMPQMMYSTKYDLENEIYKLYQSGLKFPKRTFFGKFLFVLENYKNLKVSYKKIDIKTARYEYSRLIPFHFCLSVQPYR